MSEYVIGNEEEWKLLNQELKGKEQWTYNTSFSNKAIGSTIWSLGKGKTKEAKYGTTTEEEWVGNYGYVGEEGEDGRMTEWTNETNL